jgi:hypothetical protein
MERARRRNKAASAPDGCRGPGPRRLLGRGGVGFPWQAQWSAPRSDAAGPDGFPLLLGAWPVLEMKILAGWLAVSVELSVAMPGLRFGIQRQRENTNFFRLLQCNAAYF